MLSLLLLSSLLLLLLCSCILYNFNDGVSQRNCAWRPISRHELAVMPSQDGCQSHNVFVVHRALLLPLFPLPAPVTITYRYTNQGYKQLCIITVWTVPRKQNRNNFYRTRCVSPPISKQPPRETQPVIYILHIYMQIPLWRYQKYRNIISIIWWFFFFFDVCRNRIFLSLRCFSVYTC